MRTVRNDFCFLQREGAAVSMKTTYLPDGKKELVFAVAFCRRASPNSKVPSDDYNKVEAISILKERLTSANPKYSCRRTYTGETPRKDNFVPFIKFVRDTIRSGTQRSGRRGRNVDRVFDRLPQWDQKPAPQQGLTLKEAQKQSLCGTAIRRNTSMGDVIWPASSEVAFSGVRVFSPMESKTSDTQARFTDWQALAPAKSRTISETREESPVKVALA